MSDSSQIVGFESIPDDVVREALSAGGLIVEGQLAGASNATLRCLIDLEDERQLRCVYKPVAGERPLWDFPEGTLSAREVATGLVDQALGWNLIPPTIWREDGPAGAGMCQAWVEHSDQSVGIDVTVPQDVPAGWLRIIEGRDERDRAVVLAHADNPGLQRLALLDAVVNNADRKGGHVLVDADGRRLGIDHGVTFHVEDKLRTVLWGWAGESLPDEHRLALTALAADRVLHDALSEYLADEEIDAMDARITAMLAEDAFPLPSPDWPSIPWPVF